MSDRKLKIIIASGIFPEDIGGPATFANLLCKHLPSQGCDVQVVTYGDDIAAGQAACPLVVVNKQDHILKRYFNYYKKVWELSKTSDIIYAFDLISVGVPCALVKLFRPKVKLVLRLGGDYQWEKAMQAGKFSGTLVDYYKRKKFSSSESFDYLLNNLVLQLADKVIFNAEFLRDIYVKYRGLKLEKTAIIKNIQPVVQENKKARKQESNTVLFAGRIIKVRNLYRLVDAVKLLHNENQAVRLDIVGGGPEEASLKKYIEDNNYTGFIWMPGQLTRAELKQKISESACVALPSVSEVNSNFINEALVQGKPVVLTKHTESHFVGLEHPLIRYIDPFDTEDIKAKLKAALTTKVDSAPIDLEKICWGIDKVIHKHLESFRKID